MHCAKPLPRPCAPPASGIHPRLARAGRVLLACLLLALATSGAGGAQEAPAHRSTSVEPVGLAAVLERMEDGIPHALDLADPVEEAFFSSLLGMGGLTPETRPQLLATVEATRHAHRRAAPPPPPGTLESGVRRSHVHRLRSFGATEAGFRAAGLSTLRGGSLATALWLGIFEESTLHPISTAVGGGVGPDPAVYTIEASGSSEAQRAIALMVYFLVDLEERVHGPIALRTTADRRLTPRIGGARPSATPKLLQTNAITVGGTTTITNVHPVSATGSIDDPIILCLDRTPNNSNSCQYGKNSDDVFMPIQGEIQYPAAIDLDANGRPSGSNFLVELIDLREGGGCELYGPNSESFFGDGLTLSADGTQLSWNKDSVDFGAPNTSVCFENQDLINYNFDARVTIDGTRVMASVFSVEPNTQDDGDPATAQISQIKVVSGCLAAGTRVELADGSSWAVEDFEGGGERVRSGDGALEVIGTTRGVDKELIQLRDDLGHGLRLTANHPVVLADGSIRLAHELAVGDLVKTRDGDGRLTEVRRLRYGGAVHNLTLKAPAGSRDGATLFANGILVGDAEMQEVYTRAYANRPRNMLEILPAAWHRDYLSFLEGK